MVQKFGDNINLQMIQEEFKRKQEDLPILDRLVSIPRHLRDSPFYDHLEIFHQDSVDTTLQQIEQNPYDTELEHIQQKLENHTLKDQKKIVPEYIVGEISKYALEEDEEFYLKKCHKAQNSKIVEKVKNRYNYYLLKNVYTDKITDLEKKKATWYLDQITKARAHIIKLLREQIEKYLQLIKMLSKLGINSKNTGILWCLSPAELKDTDITTLLTWAKYFEDDPNLKEIVSIMGRMKQEITYTIQETIQIQEKLVHYVPSSASKGEIVGLKLGNDISQTLAQEFSVLDDEDLDITFYMKFTESKLLCYETENEQLAEYTRNKDETITKELTKEELEEKGPVILCVDTSGSMSGTPENVAKALCLAIASKAIESNRKCYIINFSTGIFTFVLEKKMGLENLINFLKSSFHGGTDVEPAFRHALKMTQEEDFKKADTLIISDYVMPNLSLDIEKNIEESQKLGNKYYSVIIGNNSSNSLGCFDREWIYDRNSHNLHEIISSINP